MFDPVRICTILNEDGVEYVVVGGIAAVVRGSSLPTRGIDIVPSRSSETLDRLVASLDDIIDSKRAAKRPKDQMALPYLESLRDELRRG